MDIIMTKLSKAQYFLGNSGLELRVNISISYWKLYKLFGGYSFFKFFFFFLSSIPAWKNLRQAMLCMNLVF